MKSKTHADNGYSMLLKSKASPTTPEGLKAFREIQKASGLSTTEIVKHIGRKSKLPKEDEKKKQDARLEILEK